VDPYQSRTTAVMQPRSRRIAATAVAGQIHITHTDRGCKRAAPVRARYHPAAVGHQPRQPHSKQTRKSEANAAEYFLQ
jgi:hypothetical protein